MMSLPRWFTSCVVLFTSCCNLRSSWGHRQIIVTSAFIRKNIKYPFLSGEGRECLQQQQQQQHPSPSNNNGTTIGLDMDEHRAHMNYEQTHALNTATTTPIGGGGIGSSVGPSGGPPRPSADALAMQGRSKSCPVHFGDRQRQQQQEQREGANRSPVIEPIPYARVDTAKDGKMAVGDSPVVHKHNV
mmetsp:Transcript_22614/g.34484  ORF Transcript_22614/g.34484 Transcript_22614/m.34484 type:complete len:187 (-) Transcript_22614:739-1299(-)